MRHGIDLVTGGNSSNDRASPATILFQMIQGERQNLIGSKPCPVLINNAKTIGVAIQPKTELSLPSANELAHFAHAFGIRLRMMTTEEGIQFVVKNRYSSTGLFEESIEIAAS